MKIIDAERLPVARAFRLTVFTHRIFKEKRSWILVGLSLKCQPVAGVYTTNKVIAAPLLVTKASIRKPRNCRAIVVNSDVANSVQASRAGRRLRCSD